MRKEGDAHEAAEEGRSEFFAADTTAPRVAVDEREVHALAELRTLQYPGAASALTAAAEGNGDRNRQTVWVSLLAGVQQTIQYIAAHKSHHEERCGWGYSSRSY